MNPFRRKVSLGSWLRRFFGPGRRPQADRRAARHRRLYLEPLEDRTLLSNQCVDLGPLRFCAPAFTQNGNNYSADGTIQLGFAPTAGEAFRP
ncbi:MAG TPA: hypothetical protein VNK04_09255, partial [Gemmataceae bacterium]|nr:hypothetical protein [Gemmataceae bacterium]